MHLFITWLIEHDRTRYGGIVQLTHASKAANKINVDHHRAVDMSGEGKQLVLYTSLFSFSLNFSLPYSSAYPC